MDRISIIKAFHGDDYHPVSILEDDHLTDKKR